MCTNYSARFAVIFSSETGCSSLAEHCDCSRPRHSSCCRRGRISPFCMIRDLPQGHDPKLYCALSRSRTVVPTRTVAIALRKGELRSIAFDLAASQREAFDCSLESVPRSLRDSSACGSSRRFYVVTGSCALSCSLRAAEPAAISDMPGGHFFCVYSLLLLKLSAILVDAPRNHSTEALAAAPNPSCRRLWLTEAGLTTPTATTIRIAQRKRGAPAPAHAGPLPSAFDAAMAVLLRLEYLEDVHQPVLGKKPTPRWKKASSLSLALSFFHHLHPLLVMHYYRLFVACTLLTTAALAAPLPQAVDPAAARSVAADGTTPTTHFDPSSFASGPNSYVPDLHYGYTTTLC